MLAPTLTTPNFNCNSPPFLIKIKRRAKKDNINSIRIACITCLNIRSRRFRTWPEPNHADQCWSNAGPPSTVVNIGDRKPEENYESRQHPENPYPPGRLKRSGYYSESFNSIPSISISTERGRQQPAKKNLYTQQQTQHVGLKLGQNFSVWCDIITDKLLLSRCGNHLKLSYTIWRIFCMCLCYLKTTALTT